MLPITGPSLSGPALLVRHVFSVLHFPPLRFDPSLPGPELSGPACSAASQERTYKTPDRDTSDLKQRLIDTWARISQNVIDDFDEAVGEQWRRLVSEHV